MHSPNRAPQPRGRHIIILCHPERGSFNHAIAEAYGEAVTALGHDVILRDLYAIDFDPVLKARERPKPGFEPSADVARELAIIAGGDVFVLIYPIWFGMPPAMMKGYVDRVLGAGVEPDAIRRRSPTSLLGDRRLLSFTTSAASRIWLNEQGQELALNRAFDQYLKHAFGMRAQAHVGFAHITVTLSERFRRQYLHDVRTEATRLCAEIASHDAALPEPPGLERAHTL